MKAIMRKVRGLAKEEREPDGVLVFSVQCSVKALPPVAVL
jgi:hypothetical protein